MLQRRARAVRGEVDRALATAVELMGAEPADIDAHAIVMVGLFASNGWVDELAGQDELFVAVEQLPDEDHYGRLLLVHEAAHVVHSRVRGGSPWPEHNVAVGLLTEGLATHVSAQAMPGLSDAEYLWMSRGHDNGLRRAASTGLTSRRESATGHGGGHRDRQRPRGQPAPGRGAR
jgi:hypothetical protein